MGRGTWGCIDTGLIQSGCMRSSPCTRLLHSDSRRSRSPARTSASRPGASPLASRAAPTAVADKSRLPAAGGRGKNVSAVFYCNNKRTHVARTHHRNATHASKHVGREARGQLRSLGAMVLTPATSSVATIIANRYPRYRVLGHWLKLWVEVHHPDCPSTVNGTATTPFPIHDGEHSPAGGACVRHGDP